MNLQMVSAELIVDTARDMGIDARSYSGRAMYGDNCVAIVHSNAVGAVAMLVKELVRNAAVSALNNSDAPIPMGDARDAVVAATDDVSDDIDRLMEDTRTDSMGRDTVVYWPSLDWPVSRQTDTDTDYDD